MEEVDNGPCQAWVAVLAYILQNHDRGQAAAVEDNPEFPSEKEAFDILEEGGHSEHLEEDSGLDRREEVSFWVDNLAEYDL